MGETSTTAWFHRAGSWHRGKISRFWSGRICRPGLAYRVGYNGVETAALTLTTRRREFRRRTIVLEPVTAPFIRAEADQVYVVLGEAPAKYTDGLRNYGPGRVALVEW